MTLPDIVRYTAWKGKGIGLKIFMTTKNLKDPPLMNSFSSWQFIGAYKLLGDRALPSTPMPCCCQNDSSY